MTRPALRAQDIFIEDYIWRNHMRRTGLAFIATLLLLGAGQPKKAELKDPGVALQGGWSMVLLFNNGEETPAEEAKGGELFVEDDVYRSKLGATVESSRIKLDPTKSPKAIDFTYMTGFSKGKTFKGIYKIEGDDLTICRVRARTQSGRTSSRPRWIRASCWWSGSGQRPSALEG